MSFCKAGKGPNTKVGVDPCPHVVYVVVGGHRRGPQTNEITKMVIKGLTKIEQGNRNGYGLSCVPPKAVEGLSPRV